MLSRATCVSLWFLFTLLILEGTTDNLHDTEMYCDDAYRSKYIVSTSLFSLSSDTNDTNNIQGKSMYISPYKMNDNNEQYSDSSNDSSGENSVEIADEDFKKPQMSVNKHSLSSQQVSSDEMLSNELKRVREGKPFSRDGCHVNKNLNENSSVQRDTWADKVVTDQRRHPLIVVVNTQINVSLSDDGHAETSVSKRRKREILDGGNACVHTRRIIGGVSVDNIEDVPYIVFVDTGCAGTIISNIWIVTAAHCIGLKPPKYVYGGSKKLFTGCKHKIEKIIIHPNYYAKTYKADITLLKLYQPFTFSPAIKPMSMESEMPKPGICGTISGWGSTKVGARMEYYLRTTMLPIIRKEKCMMFPDIDVDQFCAGFQDAHTDSCQGDSGGPFIVNNFLVGIVSFGYKCALREIPGVYTNVPFYRNLRVFIVNLKLVVSPCALIMTTLNLNKVKIIKRELHVPTLDEVKNVFIKALKANFEEVEVEVIDCPDLTEEPFTLAAPGLGGRLTIVDVGGPPYLLPLAQKDKIYDIQPLLKELKYGDRAFVAGAGAGPWPYLNSNCELMMNVMINSNKIKNATHIASVDKNNETCVLETLKGNETRFAVLANLFLCEGIPGKVLKVHVKKRIGKRDFINTMQQALTEHYTDKLVGLGGSFVIKEGKVKQHVMPDFSDKPLNNLQELNNWLHFYDMTAPLIAVGTFISAETDLDLRVQHFHSFSHHGEGGHYHIDTTPDTVEYLGYFNLGETLYKVDQPTVALQFGKD
ncbi:PREDICTED: uncharacterized protein LOC105366625 [Ceratosolen solmsi marchali]|uniref:Uncharacterized protein LOC105366625 n=1 Tax=Ceratosolen solmsi marchali TaxID=326594 RepID=A0AAJ6YSK6_9HYME|nr:PREDICTED: uncharacterized protein LOC105366625 [Ceratosolen solmsi marchali]